MKKKKMLEKGEGKQKNKIKNDEKVVTMEENKNQKMKRKTKVTTKMKEKNDKKKNL
jgi:hypothetical protein